MYYYPSSYPSTCPSLFSRSSPSSSYPSSVSSSQVLIKKMHTRRKGEAEYPGGDAFPMGDMYGYTPVLFYFSRKVNRLTFDSMVSLLFRWRTHVLVRSF